MKKILILIAVSALAVNAALAQVTPASEDGSGLFKRLRLGDNAVVSQATNITTAVTLDACSGTITTQNATTAAGATSTFNVNNKFVTSTSFLLAIVTDYSGTLFTNGYPLIHASYVSAGVMQVKIANIHASNALNGTMKVRILVL